MEVVRDLDLAGAEAVVLVEGMSDRVALEALAERRGRNLGAEGIAIVAIGGATNMGHYLSELGPHGRSIPLLGLCDAGEERFVRRRLQQAGLGSPQTRDEMEALGFYVCVADLEDELIRALGTDAVEQVIAAEGELRSFRTFQNQPEHRRQSTAAQLRRFMGTRARRKATYARLLVEALDLTHVPRPLDGVLAHA